MSTVQRFLSTIEDPALSVVLNDCLAWDSTGLLKGEAVQAVARRLGSAVGLGAAWPLDEMPKLLYQEAARRFVGAHTAESQSAKELVAAPVVREVR